MRKSVSILGSGFSSLSAACYLAQSGYNVNIYEKNSTPGGRARQLQKDGFTFDIGPSWYWMPDVFEKFFGDFKKSVSDFYVLDRLDPAYQVYFGPDDSVFIGDSLEKICKTFDEIEIGSSRKLKKFIKKAAENYKIAMDELVYRPGVSPLELLTKDTIKKLSYFFSNIKKEVNREFKNPKLTQILQFPVLFLGAKPSDTPAFYNFMNYADFGLGTWHPKNGMYSIVKGMVKLGNSLGVKIHTDCPVDQILVNKDKAIGILVKGEKIYSDIVLSGADYHHTETLVPKEYRAYSEKFWNKKIFAPSSLLFYVGINKKVKNVSYIVSFPKRNTN